MAHVLNINSSVAKKNKYEQLLPQIQSLVDDKAGITANLANISAALKEGMGFFWVGFYFVKDKELVLGPFQGAPACTRIPYSKGVCGKACVEKKPVIVKDVRLFPGHIACSEKSRSEIVVPAFNNKGDVKLVLDVDSEKVNDFDNTDISFLQQVVSLIEKFL